MKNTVAVLLLFSCASLAQPAPRTPTGEYRNPSLGYSVVVPAGLKGVASDQTGPERGITVSLPSSGSVVIYGEPNSLEWKTPEEGIRWALDEKKCPSERREEVLPGRVGTLSGARGKMVCDGEVSDTLLAFRTRGGPIYWLTLRTKIDDERQDEKIFARFSDSFRLIPWR